MSDFVAAYGFCSSLKFPLEPGGSLFLPEADDDTLCAMLGLSGQTNLIIMAMGQREVIRVACDEDGAYIVSRSQEGTMELSFPMGATIVFDWTPQNVLDLIACAEAESDEENAPIKIPGYTAELDENGQWCYEPDESTDPDDAVEWFDCGYKFTYANGAVTKEAAPISMNLTPGVYTNATVTVNSEGKIVDIQKGCPVVFESKCASCDCPDPVTP